MTDEAPEDPKVTNWTDIWGDDHTVKTPHEPPETWIEWCARHDNMVAALQVIFPEAE